MMIPVTFMGSQSFAEKLAHLPFMKVNPLYSGGDLARTYEEDGLTIEIYHPVFTALIGESKEGFVQIRFSSADNLPSEIKQVIDFDNDTTADFTLYVNTLTTDTKIDAINSMVKQVEISSPVKEAWIVRVGLNNPAKVKPEV